MKTLLIVTLNVLLGITAVFGQLTEQSGNVLKHRIKVPNGYSRSITYEGSFGDYLRNLPLKPSGSLVKYYDGRKKPMANVYTDVVDLSIGNKDLHQCADAVMRLRAEYLFGINNYDDIHFNFTNGFRVDYNEWAQGKRIAVKGNKTWWEQKAQPSNTYASFWNYMETIFTYAGTLSLSKELAPVQVKHLQIGDVFIQGGSPGHAVIVVDMAYSEASGEKIFLLAQSYMPAQEIQILQNPNNPDLSPWYSEDFGTVLKTPEWQFTSADLKRF